MTFTITEFLKGLQSASERGKKERFRPFWSYSPEGTLEIYLSPKEGMDIQLAPNVTIQIDAANREEIIGFRFFQLKPPPVPVLDEKGEEIPF